MIFEQNQNQNKMESLLGCELRRVAFVNDEALSRFRSIGRLRSKLEFFTWFNFMVDKALIQTMMRAVSNQCAVWTVDALLALRLYGASPEVLQFVEQKVSVNPYASSEMSEMLEVLEDMSGTTHPSRDPSETPFRELLDFGGSSSSSTTTTTTSTARKRRVAEVSSAEDLASPMKRLAVEGRRGNLIDRLEEITNWRVLGSLHERKFRWPLGRFAETRTLVTLVHVDQVRNYVADEPGLPVDKEVFHRWAADFHHLVNVSLRRFNARETCDLYQY